MVNTVFVTSLLVFAVLVDCNEHVEDSGGTHMEGVSPTTLLHIDSTKQRHHFSEDLIRLSKFKVYGRLTGLTHSEIAAKINWHVASHSSVKNVVPCSDLDAAGVVALASKLLPYVDETLGSSLPEEDGRQIYMDTGKVDEHQLSSSVYRDALCAEVVKLWAHHIPKPFKDEPQLPVLEFVIPSLPVLDPTFNRTALIEEQYYAGKAVTCIAGHSAASADADDTRFEPSTLSNAVSDSWPDWPDTFHFKGLGYGPYPFWQFGFTDTDDDDGWVVNESFSDGVYDGAEFELWHSTKRQATKFYHAQCRWEWLGFNDLGHQPCVGLQLGTYGTTGKWYLYTADPDTRITDEKFCCESSFTGHQGEYGLGTINRKFMDNMKYFGEEDFHGHYYDGRAKLYILSMIFRDSTNICPWCQEMPQLPIDVWYETDLKGRPLRFGELGQDIELNGYLHDTDLPLIYEEMDPTTYDSPTFDDFMFKVPNICTTNLHGCGPGRNNRENLNTGLDETK